VPAIVLVPVLILVPVSCLPGFMTCCACSFLVSLEALVPVLVIVIVSVLVLVLRREPHL
jgi:hypothetical protein